MPAASAVTTAPAAQPSLLNLDTLPRADGAYGFPDSAAKAFLEAANELNAAIVSRAPGGAGTGLIAEGYDLKGYFIKGKSCDWGPMGGFVCMNPLLNKNGSGGVPFNQASHRDYLITLLAMRLMAPADKNGTQLLADPSAHPGLEPANVTDAQYESVVAVGGRPLQISEAQRALRFTDARKFAADLATTATDSNGATSYVLIAVDSPTAPSAAVEMVLRRPTANDPWRLYVGAAYQREYGTVSAGSTIAGTADGGTIVLGEGTGRAFPTGTFPVSVYGQNASETVTVTRADTAPDTLKVAARGALPVNGIPEGWSVRSGWRTGVSDAILSSVGGSDGNPRAGFATAYDTLANSVALSPTETQALETLRQAFTTKFLADAPSGFSIPAGIVPFWPVVGLQNPFPPYAVPAKAYLNAVTGDYDLAAVWPALPSVDQVRISELRWTAANPAAGADAWCLQVGDRLFLPVRGKPFAVESTRVRGLIVEFIPTFKEIGDGHLESDEWGNANNLVLDAVQRLNSLGSWVGAADPRGSVGRPNFAFHSDEGGRPEVTDFDFPFAAFLPREWTYTLGCTNRTCVFDKGSGDAFVQAAALLTRCGSITLQAGWLVPPLSVTASAEKLAWLFVYGSAQVPADGSDAQKLTANVTTLIANLRALLGLIPGEEPPAAARDRATTALAWRL